MALDYRRRLITAKMSSPADYQKELLVIKQHKEQRVEKQRREAEANRLKAQCDADKQERKHMKVDSSKSNTLKFGSNTNTFKDIGVDLCATKGG